MSTPPVPKASLYYGRLSIWAAAALLALEEKGYAPEEVDIKEVDLSKAENFTPTFLRLNPNGTVPTLVVPLEKTLSPDIDSRYKSITETTAVVAFLDKSRSASSRTHTTSTLPAPSLAPATPAFSAASAALIDLLHTPEADPNTLLYLAARNDQELARLSASMLPFTQGRSEVLGKLLNEESERVTEKVKTLWMQKKIANDAFLAVYSVGDKSEGDLDVDARQKRHDYLGQAKIAWEGVRPVLTSLNKAVVGPYTLGDQLSLADLQLAAWLARLVFLAGGAANDVGAVAIAKLEAHVAQDGSFTLPQDFVVPETQSTPTEGAVAPPTGDKTSKLAAFWDSMRERPSWAKVYKDGLH